MATKKNDQADKKKSNVEHKIAQESFKKIHERCKNIDGEFVVNSSDKPTITQSCATPPRPIRGNDKKD